MKSTHEDCGPIAHDEAAKIAQAYIDHAFCNDERPDFQGMRPRHSIPANPRFDTDIRLHAYIEQQRQLQRVIEAAVAWQEDSGSCHFCGFGTATDGRVFVDHLPHDDDCPLVETGLIDQAGRRLPLAQIQQAMTGAF